MRDGGLVDEADGEVGDGRADAGGDEGGCERAGCGEESSADAVHPSHLLAS